MYDTIYTSQLNRSKLLSKEEERALCVRVKSGDIAAMHKLVSANLRFVVRVAIKYSRGYDSLELQDLISVGNVGLIIAAYKFNLKYKTRFLTYAHFWIKQVIMRELANSSRMTKIPYNSFERFYDYTKSFKKLEQELGREPNIDEISTDLKINSKMVEVLGDLYVSRVDVYDEDIANESSEEGFSLRKDLLNRAVNTLPEKEKLVISHYFGLGSYEQIKSYKKIGRMIGLSHEAVRNNKNRAIAKIRTSFKKSEIVYTNFKGLIG